MDVLKNGTNSSRNYGEQNGSSKNLSTYAGIALWQCIQGSVLNTNYLAYNMVKGFKSEIVTHLYNKYRMNPVFPCMYKLGIK